MLQALDFVALGRADNLVFQFQFAILLVSFVWSVAGICRRVAAPVYAIWPFLGLWSITPEIRLRGLSPLAT